jgi:type IV secretion system protein TrbL
MTKRKYILTSLLIALIVLPAAAQTQSTVARDVLQQFQNAKYGWASAMWGYARSIFGYLAIIEFAWWAIITFLEKSELQSWAAALCRKMLWLGFFYALLLNGQQWISAITDSFTQMGLTAAGIPKAPAPSDIFTQGLTLAGALMDRGSVLAFFTNPGSSIALVIAAVLIMISYTIITISFILTMAESYVLLSVGVIFLGFGASRWTAPYTERYISLAVSIGVKILLIYCCISTGMSLAVGWTTEAQNISQSASPVTTCFDIMGGALIFAVLCWHLPRMFASLLGGSPSLTAGDGLGVVATMVGGAAAATGIAAPAAAAAAGGVAKAAKAAGGSLSSGWGLASASGAMSTASQPAPPTGSNPSAASAGNAASSAVSGSSQPAPPSNGNGSGASALKSAGNQLRSFNMSDNAGQVSPPQMPFHHED